MIDFIQGEKFITLANDKTIIYSHTHDVDKILSNPPKNPFVLITHNSDHSVDATKTMPNNLIHWFGQNINVINPKIESLPIGLENDYWLKKVNKKEIMLAKLLNQKQ